MQETIAQRRGAGAFAMMDSLRSRDYRFFWIGLFSSTFGQTMELVAISWLVLELTGSPLVLGATLLAQAGPNIVLALFAGAVADRFDRRALLVGLFAFFTVLYVVLATLTITGLVQMWHVLAYALVNSLVRVFEQPARHGLIPHIIERGSMANAVAMTSVAWQTPRPIAPAVAGIVVAVFGVGPALYACGICSFIPMVLYVLMRPGGGARQQVQGSILRNMLEGVDFVRRNEVFYALMGMAFFNSVFGYSYVTMLPVFAREVLAVGADGYGFMQGAGGVGAVVGTFGSAYIANAAGRGKRIIFGGMAFGGLIILFACSPWYAIALGLLFLMGGINQIYMISTSTVVQLRVPEHLRGRVMSIWGLTFSLIPLGGAISGVIAQFAGVQVALAIGGALVVAMAAIVAIKLPTVRNLE